MLWLKLIWILLVIKVFLICCGKNHGLAFCLSVEAVNKTQSCTDCFLFRRKTLNGFVREFSVNWLFCSDGWWCLNVSLLKQWLSYHSLHEPGSHRSQILSSTFPAAGVEGRRRKMVTIGGTAQSVCLVQQCQGRLSNTFIITTGLHRHCSCTLRVVTLQTQTCFICLLNVTWL